MHVEAPTTLEAWQGGDAVIVVTNKRGYVSGPMLEVNTGRRWQRVSEQMRWCVGTWDSGEMMRYPVTLKDVPQGPLRFVLQYSTHKYPDLTLDKKQFWPLDRTQVRPFPFSQVARAPMVSIRSVTVRQVWAGSPRTTVDADVTFDLADGAVATDNSFESSVGSSTCSVSWGTVAKQPTPTTRVVSFDASSTTTFPSGRAVVTGRVSAGRHWPLAFRIEPFDIAKVKVGQKLRFKAWPAPVPKGAG